MVEMAFHSLGDDALRVLLVLRPLLRGHALTAGRRCDQEDAKTTDSTRRHEVSKTTRRKQAVNRRVDSSRATMLAPRIARWVEVREGSVKTPSTKARRSHRA